MRRPSLSPRADTCTPANNRKKPFGVCTVNIRSERNRSSWLRLNHPRTQDRIDCLVQWPEAGDEIRRDNN